MAISFIYYHLQACLFAVRFVRFGKLPALLEVSGSEVWAEQKV
jgi:hypothetical protein